MNFHEQLLQQDYTPFGSAGPSMDTHQLHRLTQATKPVMGAAQHQTGHSHIVAKLVTALRGIGGTQR